MTVNAMHNCHMSAICYNFMSIVGIFLDVRPSVCPIDLHSTLTRVGVM